MNALLRAHSIDQENWFIARTPCACGGTLAKGSQRLVMDGDTPVDVIDAARTACGERVELAFDINEQQQATQMLASHEPREGHRYHSAPLL